MEEAAARFPQRKAYEDETWSMTFSEVRRLAASIGTGIAALQTPGRPVAVFMEKSVLMAVSLLGVSCGGCIYLSLIHITSPPEHPRRGIPSWG